MDNIARHLTAYLKTNNLPILGVSIGRAEDRRTWRIDYVDTAVPADRANGAALIGAFDPEDAGVLAQEATERRDSTLWTPAMVALVTALEASGMVDLRAAVEAEFDAGQAAR